MKSEQNELQLLLEQANIAYQTKRYEHAILLYKKCLELSPQSWETYLNLGAIYLDRNEMSAAKHCNDKALSLSANSPLAFNNIGAMYSRNHDYEKARYYFNQALLAMPSDPTILCNVACLPDTTKDLAIALLQKAIQPLFIAYQKHKATNCEFTFSAAQAKALARYANHCQEICAWGILNEIKPLLNIITRAQLNNNLKTSVEPFMSLSLLDDPLLQKNIAIMHSTSYSRPPSEQYKHNRRNNDKLRIGYLSAHFNSNAVSLLIAPIIPLHDRAKVTVYGYSITKKPTQEIEEIKLNFDVFHDLNLLSNKDAAKQIYNDNIDILIDLSGYTADRRIEILAYKPAPIQCHYLSFVGTMGAEFMDYTILHKTNVPPNTQHLFTEKIAYLKDTLIASPGFCMPTNNISRRDYNLPDNAFVFYCFNQPYRINAEVFEVWSEILTAIPNSVLWMAESSTLLKENLQNYALKHNIDSSRIIFSGTGNITDNWRNRLADLGLDTFVLSSGTASILNAWVGLPCITLAGILPHARTGAAIWNAMGINELIVHSKQEYINLAIQLARNKDYLQAIKNKLAVARNTAPLFSMKQFVHNLEELYYTMWKHYQS